MWISLTTAINFFAVILLAISWDLVSIFDGLARCIVFVVQTNYLMELVILHNLSYRSVILIVLAVTILPLYYSFASVSELLTSTIFVCSLSSTFAHTFHFIHFRLLIYSFYSDDDDEDSMGAQNAAASSGYDPLNLWLD